MKILCKECNLELSVDLYHEAEVSQLSEEDGEDFIQPGNFFVSDGNYYTGTEGEIIINIADLRNVKNTSIGGRLNGCCGLDGTGGLNKVCTNGHEVATEKSDCWIAHAVIFDMEKIVVE